MVKWMLLIGLMIGVNSLNAQVGTELQLLKHINFLSKDSIKVRVAGSQTERNANKYIRENWGDGKRTSFYSWEYYIANGGDSLLSEMVGTFLYNKAKATILIGADLEKSEDIALLIGIQNQLSQMKLDANVMVVSVTSINDGHQGLDYLATHMPKKARDIRLVIHINEIGNIAKENPSVVVTATSGIFEELELMTKLFEIEKTEDSILLENDTKNYFERGVQCLSISAGDGDRPMNTNGMHQAQEFLVQWIITK